jgi:hypothetical protein
MGMSVDDLDDLTIDYDAHCASLSPPIRKFGSRQNFEPALTRLPNVESVSSAGFAPTVAHAMMRFKPMR